MTFRLNPEDNDFNLLDFKNDFVVSAADGLKRYQSVDVPPGLNVGLEFGKPGWHATSLGQINIKSDGGFTYRPDQAKWDNDLDRIDRVQYWVRIIGRSVRTTGRFAIKQGSSETNNSLVPLPTAPLVPTPGYLLDGGAYGFQRVANWLHERSRNVSGNRLVILSSAGSSDEGAFEKFQRPGTPRWDKVQSFVINTTAAANDGRVKNAIEEATAIFIEGGNQGKYWSFWNGTDLQKSLTKRLHEIPIGGSSAGMAVLGGEIFLPLSVGSNIMSAEAMSNPLDVFPGIRFSVQSFLNIPGLENVYLETHFTRRKRLGRTAAILAVPNTAKRAIMADEDTALSIDLSGVGTVVGNGRIFFAKLASGKPRLRADSALTTGDIEVVALKAGSKFDIKNWSLITTGLVTTFQVNDGVISSKNKAARTQWHDEWYNEYSQGEIDDDPDECN